MARRNVTKAEEKILEAAKKLADSCGASWPLELLDSAVKAAEWYVAMIAKAPPPPRKISAKERLQVCYGTGPDALAAGVNPLLLPFVLKDVARVRAGEEGWLGRPALRKVLAAAVPAGRRGKAKSFLPEKVARAKEQGWSDEMIMAYLHVASRGAIRTLLSQARKRGERA